jgi:hypothetical protein
VFGKLVAEGISIAGVVALIAGNWTRKNPTTADRKKYKSGLNEPSI